MTCSLTSFRPLFKYQFLREALSNHPSYEPVLPHIQFLYLLYFSLKWLSDTIAINLFFIISFTSQNKSSFFFKEIGIDFFLKVIVNF